MELNDYELIYLIGLGNEQAYQTLLKKYERLIYSIIHQRRFREFSDYEMQEAYGNCLIVFDQAIKNYRDDLKVSFATFLYRCVECRFLNFQRQMGNKGNQLYNNYLSLDVESNNSEIYSKVTQESLLIFEASNMMNKNLRAQLLNEFIMSLPALEKELMQMKLAGYKIREIAEKLNQSESFIQRRIKKISQNAFNSIEKYENN